MWLARPDLPRQSGAAGRPPGYRAAPTPDGRGVLRPPDLVPRPRALERAARRCRDANDRAELFLRGQASAFNEVGAIWAPRYRQATFGAFLTDARPTRSRRSTSPIATSPPRSTSSSQRGRRPADHPRRAQPGRAPPDAAAARTRRRHAAREADRRRLCRRLAGLDRPPTCRAWACPPAPRADQTGCILSWQSFAEPADPSLILDTYRRDHRLRRPAAHGHADALHQPADRHAPTAAAPAERQPRHAGPDDRPRRPRRSSPGAVAARAATGAASC